MYAVDPADQGWGQLAQGTPAPPESWGQHDPAAAPWGQSAFFVASLEEVYPTPQEGFDTPKKTAKQRMPKLDKSKIVQHNQFEILGNDEDSTYEEELSLSEDGSKVWQMSVTTAATCDQSMTHEPIKEPKKDRSGNAPNGRYQEHKWTIVHTWEWHQPSGCREGDRKA